jgi:hypothetical protein
VSTSLDWRTKWSALTESSACTGGSHRRSIDRIDTNAWSCRGPARGHSTDRMTVDFYSFDNPSPVRSALMNLINQKRAGNPRARFERLVIGGRYRTRFSSAFVVAAPILPAKIVSVERVDCCGYVLPDIDIDLNRTLGR